LVFRGEEIILFLVLLDFWIFNLVCDCPATGKNDSWTAKFQKNREDVAFSNQGCSICFESLWSYVALSWRNTIPFRQERLFSEEFVLYPLKLSW